MYRRLVLGVAAREGTAFVVPLLDVVWEGLMDWYDANQDAPVLLSQSVKNVAATVGKAIACLLAGFSMKVGVPGGPEVSYEINKAIAQASKFDEADMAARVPRSFYHAAFKALQKAFSEFVGEAVTIVRVPSFFAFRRPRLISA
jgi:hypothetical protein